MPPDESTGILQTYKLVGFRKVAGVLEADREKSVACWTLTVRGGDVLIDHDLRKAADGEPSKESALNSGNPLGHSDTNSDKSKTFGDVVMPDTPGFRKLWRMHADAAKAGKKLVVAQAIKQVATDNGVEYDALEKAFYRYKAAKS